MLEVSGIRIRLSQLDGSDAGELSALRRAVAKKLRVPERELACLERRRRSIDARKKNDILLTFTARVGLRAGEDAERALLGKLARARAEKGV